MDIYSNVNELLQKKKYLKALEEYKVYVNSIVESACFNESRFSEELKGKKILINTSGNFKVGRIFCEPLIQWLKGKKQIKLDNYFLQCQFLNKHLEILHKEVEVILVNLQDSNAEMALFKIISSFENIIHEILDDEFEEKNQFNLFEHLINEKENIYESLVESLNIILKRWIEINQEGKFNKKATKEKDFYKLKPNEINSTQIEKILNFKWLYWLIDEVTINNLEMNYEKDYVAFKNLDLERFIRNRLFILREDALNKKITIDLMKNRKTEKEIDFNEILELKRDNKHFALKLGDVEILERMAQSIEIGRTENIKISYILKINNLAELSYKDVNLQEAFIFYYCLRNFADIYYNATKLFIKNYNTKPIAPFLSISIEIIYNQFKRVLSKVFKRNLTLEDFNSWLTFYNFGEDNIYDLFYKPIIKVQDKIIILPSIFLRNNFYKTYAKHLQLLKVDLSEKGKVFEKSCRQLFKDANMKVYESDFLFNYRSEKENKTIQGDIDVIAIMEDHIYISEVKNCLDPVEIGDYRGYIKVLKKANEQIEKILEYINKNPEEFYHRIGFEIIDGIPKMKIVPLIIMSGFYKSGENINGTPILDYNSLDKFINDANLKLQSQNKIYIDIPIRSKELKVEEFNKHISEPYYYGLNGCYGPMLYQMNEFNLSGQTVLLFPNLPPLNLNKYRFSKLFPNEKKLEELIRENN